jgi:hypothetical protein
VMIALFKAARRRDIRFEIIDDVITNLYAMRNPDKLTGITIPRAISR